MVLAALAALVAWGFTSSDTPLRATSPATATQIVGPVAVFPGAEATGVPARESWDGRAVLVYHFLAAGPPAAIADWYEHQAGATWQRSSLGSGAPSGSVDLMDWTSLAEVRLLPNPSLVWSYPVQLERRLDTHLDIGLSVS